MIFHIFQRNRLFQISRQSSTHITSFFSTADTDMSLHLATHMAQFRRLSWLYTIITTKPFRRRRLTMVWCYTVRSERDREATRARIGSMRIPCGLDVPIMDRANAQSSSLGMISSTVKSPNKRQCNHPVQVSSIVSWPRLTSPVNSVNSQGSKFWHT